MRDLKLVYQAPSPDAAELALLQLSETWSDKYRVAVRLWEIPSEICGLICINNAIEGYNRANLRK
jgi:transposase-like protein